MLSARTTEILEIGQGSTSKIPASTPVTLTTTSGQIVAANLKRKHIVLQNNSTQPAVIRLGTEAASTTAYSFTLGKATAARDGLGGSITIKNYQGAIQGIVATSTTVISIMEIVGE